MLMGKALKQDIDHAFSGVRFTVGRDENGCWIVDDHDGVVGGIFRDRASAVHFAMFESDHQPGAVCCVPDGVMISRRASAAVSDASQRKGATSAGPLDRASFRII